MNCIIFVLKILIQLKTKSFSFNLPMLSIFYKFTMIFNVWNVMIYEAYIKPIKNKITTSNIILLFIQE